MVAIVVRPQALDDLEDIGRFIGQDNPSRAVSFVNSLHLFISTLADYPLRHPAYPALGDVRIAGYERYQILFRVGDSQVTVIRVIHAARDLTRLVIP